MYSERMCRLCMLLVSCMLLVLQLAGVMYTRWDACPASLCERVRNKTSCSLQPPRLFNMRMSPQPANLLARAVCTRRLYEVCTEYLHTYIRYIARIASPRPWWNNCA